MPTGRAPLPRPGGCAAGSFAGDGPAAASAPVDASWGRRDRGAGGVWAGGQRLLGRPRGAAAAARRARWVSDDAERAAGGRGVPARAGGVLGELVRPPCAHEAPELERLASSAVGRGRVVAVDWSDPETGKAREFVKRYAWTFPVLRDGDGAVGNEYRMTSLPTSSRDRLARAHHRRAARAADAEAVDARARAGGTRVTRAAKRRRAPGRVRRRRARTRRAASRGLSRRLHMPSKRLMGARTNSL